LGLPKITRKRYYWEQDESTLGDYTEHKLPETPSNWDYNDATEHHSATTEYQD